MQGQLLTTLLLLLSFSYSLGQIGFQLPVQDQSDQDPGLQRFIKDLKIAAFSKDTLYIQQAFASEGYVDFDGGKSVNARQHFSYYFVRRKRNRSFYSPKFWDNLSQVMKTGGGGFDPEDPNSYYMPFTAINLIPDEVYDDAGIELGSHVLITGTRVNIRSKPSLKGRVLTQMSYDIAQLNMEKYDPDSEWVALLLYDGEEAYVFGKYVQYLGDLRMLLVKEGDEWKIQGIGAFH